MGSGAGVSAQPAAPEVADATSPLLTTALAAHAAGLCVYAPKQDGSKMPAAQSWAQFQNRQTTEKEVRRLYAQPWRTGIGYFTGTSSGNLEVLDFDDEEAWVEYQQLITDHELDELWTRVTTGYHEVTPSGGHHIFWRSESVEGNKKVASAQAPRRD